MRIDETLRRGVVRQPLTPCLLQMKARVIDPAMPVGEIHDDAIGAAACTRLDAAQRHEVAGSRGLCGVALRVG